MSPHLVTPAARTAVRVTTLRVDGLATDLCLPATPPGPHPAVLIRTPYDRRAHRAELRAWAARGFAAVAQDVRGRYGSEGDWRPYGDHEAADGASALRWIRGRVWSDGRIVASGASYGAFCALALPGADAVIAAVPALGLAETAREPTGPERLHARAGWWAAHGDRREPAARPGPVALDRLPVSGLLDLPAWPALWAASRRPLPAGDMPLLAVGGTRDAFAGDTVRLWRGWRGPARLLLGPWGHGLTADPAPEARPAHRLNLGSLYADWARAALAGSLQGHGATAALGDSDHWCVLDSCAGTRASYPPQPFGFDDPTRLRPLRGVEFVADPARPVRSDDLAVPDTAPADRCLLVGPPLPRPLDLLGPAEARLDATADTPSADWALRLTALTPDGHARPLATGVVRRSRPGPFTVPLGVLARRLDAGTRLRVEVAGHHFPAHARNPHTGENPVTATRLTASHRAVRLTGSRLLLPVAPRIRKADPRQEIPK
ncbi:CocE/NonD family hydrolase [Streptomyces sp. MUM 203J]|uniref:CocE/NonD family hydrolase n=1 Tax=Streptomyces sp. MUM 203J TaxID=2791990 RepID=UPI001F038A87|nr:CocE/NonD family hydrolase [Streptomyces sp. MUM 203J]MCH0541564.1 CocE/NonD family hydrolase [Streptomyces sp. MUM 203J]